MKYFLGLAIGALILTGCGTSDETTYTETPDNNKNTTIYSGGGDVDYNDVVVGENGTYINNGDGTVTYTGGDVSGDVIIGSGDSNGDGTLDVEPGVYSDAYDQAQCTAAGFFWCPLENRCLEQDAIGGTCTAEGTITEGVTVN